MPAAGALRSHTARLRQVVNMVNMPNLTRTSQRHADLTSQVASVHAAVVKVDEKADRVLEGQAALAQGQVVVKQGVR